MTDNSPFEHARDALEQALRDSLRAFAEWYAREWPFRETEAEWRKTYAEPYPGDEWVKAYNAGVEAVLGALDAFLDEHGY